MFSFTAFTELLGNVFRQWMFLYYRTNLLAGWRPSLTNLLLLY
jgi:hypothetical protein